MKKELIVSAIAMVVLVVLAYFLSGCVSCVNENGRNQYNYCSVIGQSANGEDDKR